MGCKRISMNEDLFVRDCAIGSLTYTQLASKYGISRESVGRIVRGERRRELAGRIAKVKSQAARYADRELTCLALEAVDVVRSAMAGSGEALALRAARDVLDRVLGRAGSSAQAARQAAWAENDKYHFRSPLEDLSPETKLRVLEELGGPTSEGAEALGVTDDMAEAFWNDEGKPAAEAPAGEAGETLGADDDVAEAFWDDEGKPAAEAPAGEAGEGLEEAPEPIVPPPHRPPAWMPVTSGHRHYR